MFREKKTEKLFRDVLNETYTVSETAVLRKDEK